MLPVDIESIHHVALPVRDLERSARFYKDVLGLVEIARPAFPFVGKWFQVGDQQLHLIVHPGSTLRTGKPLDSRDGHFAMRVRSFQQALESLRAKGFSEDRDRSDPFTMRVVPDATAGFPQIQILDPDRNVIEINSAQLD